MIGDGGDLVMDGARSRGGERGERREGGDEALALWLQY
jgi:hypothetical protein